MLAQTAIAVEKVAHRVDAVTMNAESSSLRDLQDCDYDHICGPDGVAVEGLAAGSSQDSSTEVAAVVQESGHVPH